MASGAKIATKLVLPKKKADPCITQGPAHQNKTKNQLFIFRDLRTAIWVNYCF